MKLSTIIGIIFTIIVGTLLHFTYDWSGKNSIVATFSAVNESTWEHLKLLFFPFFVYTIFEYFIIGKDFSNYITAKAVGLVIGLIAIPIIFYTYSSLLGSNILILDILTFILGVLIAYVVSTYILLHDNIEFNTLSYLILMLLLIAFIIFTFQPPKLAIFLDPVTNTYGKN